MAKRRTFFAVNRLSSLERKRGGGAQRRVFPDERAYACAVKSSLVETSLSSHADCLSSCFKAKVFVETYSWKIVFSSFLLKIEGSELRKLGRKYVKLSEMKQCGLLPWGRDFYSKTLIEKASILMCVFIVL